MPMSPRRARDGDDDELTVDELVAELRDARRIQGELVSVLHHDGEARTRKHDGGAIDRLVGHSVPFLVGLLLGATAAYSGIVGRLSIVETKTDANGAAITSMRNDARETLAAVNALREAILNLPTDKRR